MNIDSTDNHHEPDHYPIDKEIGTWKLKGKNRGFVRFYEQAFINIALFSRIYPNFSRLLPKIDNFFDAVG